MNFDGGRLEVGRFDPEAQGRKGWGHNSLRNKDTDRLKVFKLYKISVLNFVCGVRAYGGHGHSVLHPADDVAVCVQACCTGGHILYLINCQVRLLVGNLCLPENLVLGISDLNLVKLEELMTFTRGLLPGDDELVTVGND